MFHQIGIKVVHIALTQSKFLILTDNVLAEAKLFEQVIVGDELLLLLIDVDEFPLLALAARIDMLDSYSDAWSIHIIVPGFVIRSLFFFLEIFFDIFALFLN